MPRKKPIPPFIGPLTPRSKETPFFRHQCKCGIRPCPFVACHHHMWPARTGFGSPRRLRCDKGPLEIKHTCVLDLADRGGMDYTEIGKVFEIDRTRAHQIGRDALVKLASAVKKLGGSVFLAPNGSLVLLYEDRNGRTRVCHDPRHGKPTVTNETVDGTVELTVARNTDRFMSCVLDSAR